MTTTTLPTNTIRVAVTLTIEISREEYNERFGVDESVAEIREYVKAAATAAVASELDFAEVNGR